MRSRDRTIRPQPRIALCTCLLLLTAVACDKTPTLPELLGTKQPVDGKVPRQQLAPEAEPAASGPPVLLETPVARSPQQIVDAFFETEPRRRTSAQLEQLLQLDAALLEQITTLDLSGSPFHDASAGLLPRFPALRRLDLSGTALTSRGLSEVGRMTRLQSLRLDHTTIDGRGLEALVDLSELQELSLVSTPISDAAFAHLANMHALEVLRVSGMRNLQGRQFDELVSSRVLRNLRELEASSTGFGYYGLRNIDRLQALEVLRIADAQVSDRTLQAIGRCRNLKVLDLRNNPVGDPGLRQLARLSNLESLWLAKCSVSDAGLNHLRGLKTLKFIDLSGSFCTPGAVRRLKDEHLTTTTIRLEGQEF